MNQQELEQVYSFEDQEWIDSLDYLLENEPPERVRILLEKLQARAQERGIHFCTIGNTPYINTISADQEEVFPGNRDIERKIKSITRWNAMAMVNKANKKEEGIGGHISTYASAATLLEVGFNHFFRAKTGDHPGDIVYFQGHAAPGVYARSFLEGRLSEKDLDNFRRELEPGGGLSSYPHPRLMPNYWQFPTVSMGLSPIMAIYQARFNRYMEDNGLIEKSDQKIWAFLGDGEMDEPESMGAITLASREKLDNLIFVVNCNLQRLDGPVRGNSKIIQELETAFKGAGWNVIKVIWGSDWDPLLEKDKKGQLVQRMNEVVDGQLQKYVAVSGDYIRNDFFGKRNELLALVEHYSDEQLEKLKRGGHDPVKVYNGYNKAVNFKGSPTVILAQTIKGYGMGEAGEGRNVTHQQKKLNEEELRHFRGRFGIPISDEELAKSPFYKPAEDSEEIKYLKKQREKLGGFMPRREVNVEPLKLPDDKIFQEYLEGSGDRPVATTMVIVQLLSKLLKDKDLGRLIVPIVPDESRTFGMDALFRQVGIYAHTGQLYEPVDRESLLYYKESKDGAILEEGITEAGSMSSFIAAGTAYATHGVNAIPFYIFYSMFGFQRVGDFIWAAADARSKGFLVGGTSGRTTLPGEGLQHQDGHSHVLALSVPNVKAYDPAFAYEIAVIVKEGIRRMYVEGEDIMYYITVLNEKYHMPPIPGNIEKDILNGMYKYKKSNKKSDKKAHLFGSGALMNEVLKAGEILENDYGVSVDTWSITSYKSLYENARETERHNLLNTAQEKNFIQQSLENEEGVFVAVSDYMKVLPFSLNKWFPKSFVGLGTDGFGRSDSRKALRDFFEVDHRYIVINTLKLLLEQGKIEEGTLQKAFEDLKINREKISPASY